MNTTRRPLPLALALAMGAAVAPAAQAAEGDPMTWVFAPYIWAPSTSAELSTPLVEPGGGVSSDFFPDIIDKIEGAFLGRLEGQGDRFGFFADMVYLKLGDNRDFAVGSTDSDLKTWLVDVAAVWSPGDTRYEGFEVFAGLRYIDVELDVTLDPINPDLPKVNLGPSQDYTDFLAGARYIARFHPRWSFTGKLDGSGGDTEGTWSAAGTFGYQHNPGGGIWGLGYRYMSIDLEAGSETLEIDLSGPTFGYAFVW